MISYIEKHRIFALQRIWFPTENYKSLLCGDLVKIMRSAEPHVEYENYQGYLDSTLMTNLQLPVVQILSEFSKTVRYEINRSKKDDLLFEFYDAAKIMKNMELLQDFRDTYFHFCDMLGDQEQKTVYNDQHIWDYIKNSCVLLTKVTFEHGKVYHLYVHDESQAVLIYSASDFRNEDVDRNLAGRANKRLHFEDMKHLKEMGILQYDWGNVSSFENPNGIDGFKMSFGGVKTAVYSYIFPHTKFGKLLFAGKKFVER